MEFERDQSEFNMAVSYLNRLNGLLAFINESSISLDTHSWFHGLLALSRELSTEMKKEEALQASRYKDQINMIVGKVSKQQARLGTKSVPHILYDSLHEFELLLRKVLKDSGLQMKMKERAEFALK